MILVQPNHIVNVFHNIILNKHQILANNVILLSVINVRHLIYIAQFVLLVIKKFHFVMTV